MIEMNLVDNPWIPVAFAAGNDGEVGIRELLTQAHEIRAVAIEPSFAHLAVIRLLLAVTIDALGAPVDVETWVERWNARKFDNDQLGSYLDTVRSRFNLFDDTAPFGQVAELRTPKGETKSISHLIPHIATGNNVPLFATRTDAEPPTLRAAEAARWLVAAHGYDTAGIKSGADGDPAVKNGKVTASLAPLGQIGAVLACGRNMFETIVLNSVIEPNGRETLGIPAWRKSPVGPQWSEAQPTQLLGWLTFQSRRIRLIQDKNPNINGEPTVSQVVITAGDKPSSIPEFDPHTIWRAVKNPKPGDSPFRPMRHRSDWTAWQGLAALLSTVEDRNGAEYVSSPALRQIGNLSAYEDLPLDYPLEVLITGVEYGNMQAVVENTISDQIPLSVVALQEDAELRQFLLDLIVSHEGLAIALNDLDRDLRAIHHAEPVPWGKGQRLGSIFTHRLDPAVRRILSGLQSEPEKLAEAQQTWRLLSLRAVLDMGNDRLAGVPTSAYRGARSNGSQSQGSEPPIVLAERRFRSRVQKALREFDTKDVDGEPTSNERTG